MTLISEFRPMSEYVYVEQKRVVVKSEEILPLCVRLK